MTSPSPAAGGFSVDLQLPNFNEELAMLGVTGSITYAPLGTDIPTGMDPYEAPCVNLGWVSDEGLTEAIAKEKSTFIPWQTNSPIRSAVTSEEFTFNAVLWTIGGLANAMRYGVPESDMKWDEAGQFVEFVQGGELPKDYRFGLGFDILDGEKHRRFWLPEASVEESSDVTYTKGELVGYPLTWRANLSGEHGFSILRRFKEGWKPGTAGSLLAGSGGIGDLGDWSRDVNAPAESDSEEEPADLPVESTE